MAQFCTLEDTVQVDCVVANGYKRLQPPASHPVLTDLSVGEVHACGIKEDGQRVCWGDNYYGQLNILDVNRFFVQIDADANHTCALDTSGVAVCWGLNTN